MKTHSLYIFHPGRLEDIAGYRIEAVSGEGSRGGRCEWSLASPRYKCMAKAGLSPRFRPRIEDGDSQLGCRTQRMPQSPCSFVLGFLRRLRGDELLSDRDRRVRQCS